MVYVSGAISQPGVYEAQQGDRLQDAVTAAGGLLPDADTSALNMASLVQDEQHYHFPTIDESKDPPLNSPEVSTTNDNQTHTTDAPSPDNPLDLNTATFDQLQELPGIGAVKAHAIVDFRNAHGPFGEISEVTTVPGIGPVTLENIKHLITVNRPAP